MLKYNIYINLFFVYKKKNYKRSSEKLAMERHALYFFAGFIEGIFAKVPN